MAFLREIVRLEQPEVVFQLQVMPLLGALEV